MARRKRQHWMNEIIDSLRERMADAVPTVVEGIRGDVPFGHVQPSRNDEVKEFLNMNDEQRQMLFTQMGPEQYQKWSEGMMGKLSSRFGPAAQVLFPMLQGAPIETLAQGVPLDDSSLGVAAAEAEITDLLGFDPFE